MKRARVCITVLAAAMACEPLFLARFSSAGAQSTGTTGRAPQAPAAPPAYKTAARSGSPGQGYHPIIPETWDDLRSFDVPLANPAVSPEEVSWDYYYRTPWRAIYKSYPVYAPGHEPPGYFDWLKQQEPEVLWGIDSEGHSHKPALATEADWTKIGEMVFDAPIAYDSAAWGTAVASVADVRDPAWYASTGAPVGADGILPFARFVIRKRGVVELGQQSCGMCHTRVMPDGSVVKGAQGNFPFERAAAYRLEKLASQAPDKDQLADQARRFLRRAYSTPWLNPDPEAVLDRMSLEEIAGVLKAIPPGVIARTGSSPLNPIQTPDLIGVKDRRFLDHTGLGHQNSIGDLMRYAALNQDMIGLGRFGAFIPEGIDARRLPDPSTRSRYLDEELYALGLFIYSLEPPPNPHKLDATAERGRQVFEREGCARCHTPPLYTSNKLTPALGFTPSTDQLRDQDILMTSVATDPTLALGSRRGTGFYKVPSLQGLWYRGMFPHDGRCATLEDWFDARRLRDDYVPTGFKGYNVQTRAVKGHPFGLDLPPEDKQALIAFLKTL
jgi:cytochrome c553